VNFLRHLALQGKKKLDDSSRLDVVEITSVPDMLPSMFPSWSGLRNYQQPGKGSQGMHNANRDELIPLFLPLVRHDAGWVIPL
jgi:hypothetical protein